MDFSDVMSVLQEIDDSMTDSEYLLPETSLSEEEKGLRLEELKTQISPLIRKRAAIKRKITLLLKAITSDPNMERDGLRRLIQIFEAHLPEVDSLNIEILDLYFAEKFVGLNEQAHNEEAINAAIYTSKMAKVGSDLRTKAGLTDKLVSTPADIFEREVAPVTAAAKRSSPLPREAKLPSLKIRSFSGEKDRDYFRTFLSQFENLIGYRSDITDASKLLYLKNYLEGPALAEVVHLHNSNENYKLALQLLKDAYMDIPFVVNELQHQIHLGPSRPLDSKDIQGIREYVAELRATFTELKELGFNYLDGDKAAASLASHMVFDHLPVAFRRELQNLTFEEYPSLLTVFERYHMVLKNLGKFGKSRKGIEKNGKTDRTYVLPLQEKETPRSSSFNLTEKKATKSFPDGSLHCKFCNRNNHTMRDCRTYATYAGRIARCVELKLCTGCSSEKHLTENCPAKNLGLTRPCPLCKAKDHIAALCPQENLWTNGKGKGSSKVKGTPKLSNGANGGSNTHSSATDDASYSHNHLYINTGQRPLNMNILPTATVEFRSGQKKTQVRSLLDLGAQSSYLHPSVLQELGLDHLELPGCETTIKTFLGEEMRKLRKVSLEIDLKEERFVKTNFLIDENMEISFEVPGGTRAMHNVCNETNTRLADRSYCDAKDEKVVIHALLGTDILSLLRPFSMKVVCGGSALVTAFGYSPYGPVDTFLTHKQRKQLSARLKQEESDRLTTGNPGSGEHPQRAQPNQRKLRADPSSCLGARNSDSGSLEVVERMGDNSSSPLDSIVSTIIEPTHSYFDPISFTHDEADIDLGLEKLYSLETIGIKADKELGTLDELAIKQFKDSIVFKDGRYHVKLPWYDEILEQVPSNHRVALATLNKVYDQLRTKNLVQEYEEVFKQQLAEGIIEEVEVGPSDFHKYIFIPHRAVIKTDAQVTTKFRVVYNCSLRVGKAPSLNQASYGGVDLMSSLYGLLLKFRSNQFVIMGDIRKAFLMIKLKEIEDRNRFLFFWKENGILKIYRFTSLIFGLKTSPFVLNYVIKHHASKYEADLVTQLLLNNFYVDNFLYTSSDPSELEKVYKTVVSRMAEGGFQLQSWNTNLDSLKESMYAAENAATHGCTEERVLGYRYDVDADLLRLADFTLMDTVVSKRQLLSQINSIFDPLSLFVPVTIKGRLLMRQAWASEVSWDGELGEDLCLAWKKLLPDLIKLKEVAFPRAAFDKRKGDLSLNVFCDSSKEAFGFSCYMVQGGKSSLLMAKSKVAPVKGRTLPSLELTAVFLALKCLPTILETFAETSFRTVNIFTDSQICLQWLSSENTKIKQIFIRNRISDIKSLVREIKAQNLNVAFWYVRTDENPADLLTRGISFKEFSRKLDLWQFGPKWASLAKAYWPSDHNLGNGLSSTSSVVAVTNDSPPSPPLLNFSDFNTAHHLFKVCAVLYRFGDKTRNISSDCYARAQQYCLKAMQLEGFHTELMFLRRAQADPPPKEPVPDLVNRLNLFIDEKGLIRSRGRISRCNYYNFEVINPVLLHKSHQLTYLIVRDAHVSCLHLGLQATLTNLRMRGYWITSARTSIRKILSECPVCNKYNNLCYRYPKFTNFTKARVNFFRPYGHVGVDFTKAWEVKDASGKISKMYILIYTCLNIRAVHLDLIPDMGTKSFVMSFQRFTHKFGVCKYFYSDNARSFIQGGDVLAHSLASNEFQEFMQVSGIKHRRIPLYSPWFGAYWERMIRVVKDCIYRVMGRHVPNYFEFITFLGDVENVVNNRPLTYVTSAQDVLPLTPNSFLKPQNKLDLVVRTDNDPEDPVWEVSERTARDRLIASFQDLGKRLEHFRERWYKEYLVSLREFSRDLYASEWVDRVRVGDVVLIESPTKPRPFWQMGRVLRLISSTTGDGRVRSVLLKTPGGQNYYPIKILHPLELSVTHSGNGIESGEAPLRKDSDMDDIKDSTTLDIAGPSTDKTRKAAMMARQKCQQILTTEAGDTCSESSDITPRN